MAVLETFGDNLPLTYYNMIAKDIPKDALAHHYNEDDTSGPFTAAHKNVSNPNRQQNTWPLVMRTSDHWIWRSRWGNLLKSCVISFTLG